MKIYERFISCVLAFPLLLSSVFCSVALAANDYMILETVTEEAAGESVLTPDATVVNSYSYSAKWEKTDSSNKVVQLFKPTNPDITSYQYFNFSAYSETATGSTINVAVFSTSRNENNKQGYLMKGIPVDWTGWKTISLPISGFAKKYSPDLSSIERIDFDARVWNAGDVAASPDTVLYFEKVWLSEKSPLLAPAEPGVIAQFDSEEAAALDKTGTLTPDSTVAKHYDWSAKWQNTHTTKNAIVQLSLSGIDFTQYKNFAAWIYSEKATGSTINIAAFSNSRNVSNRQGYILKGIPVDWTGWKLVSVPIAEFTQRYDPDLTDMERVDFDARVWMAGDVPASAETVLYFEKVWLTDDEVPPCTLVSSGAAGADDVPVLGACAKFTYNNEIDANTAISAVTVAGGGVLPDYTVTVDKNTVLVTFSELAFQTEYTVNVKDTLKDCYGGKAPAANVKFKTLEKDVWASLPQQQGNKIISTAFNPTDGEKTAALNVVNYNSDGTVKSMAAGEAVIKAGEKTEISAEYQLSGGYIKAFVTDGGEGLLHSGYLYIDADGAKAVIPQKLTGTEQSKLALTRAAVENDRFIVEGTIEGMSPRSVLISIKNEEGLIYRDVMLSENGAFQAGISALGAKEGDYMITAAARCANKEEKSVRYLSELTRKAVYDAVNGAAHVASVEKVIKEYREALAIAEDANTAFIAKTLFEQKPYADFWAIVSMADRASALLLKLNSISWSELTEFICENNAIILYGSDYFTEYEKMSGNEQNKINKKLTDKTYADFDDFRDQFGQAMAEKQSGGSSGGGGGGGGSSSGQKNYYSFDDSLIPSENTKPEEQSVFCDIGDYKWAERAIASLYEKGIVSKAENGRFRPADRVTRAEFVKMLVQMLRLETDKECYFADVSKGHWSYPYIAAAADSGIVKGTDSGCFGTEEPISRQDMAVMLFRACNMTAQKGEAFSDDGAISPYAKDAVYTMRTKGIISGMGDGSFAPLAFANRAQAAQIIFTAEEVEK